MQLGEKKGVEQNNSHGYFSHNEKKATTATTTKTERIKGKMRNARLLYIILFGFKGIYTEVGGC